MAFDFPNPPTADPVTNPATGVTYQYDAASQTWVVISNAAAETLGGTLDDLKADVSSLQSLLPAETSARQQGDATLQDQIDGINLSNYYTKSQTYSQTEVNNLIDNIDTGGNVNLDDYYTKTEVDDKISEIEVTKGTARRYTLDGISANPTIRQGKMHLDNAIAGVITYIALAPLDENGIDRPLGEVGDTIELVRPSSGNFYRYKINSIIPDLANVEYVGGTSNQDLFFEGQPFDVYVYPTQVNVADYYTKDECDSRFQRVDQANQLDNELRQLIASSVANLATKPYVDDEINKIVGIFYGDYPPAGDRSDGDIWFDSMHLRLNIWSQGAWINPDRNDGASLENRITALEARLAQLEGN